MVEAHGCGHYAIAIDPSFINKAGRKTPGIGYFWSGCAGAVKRGLAITGLAAIDIDNHTGFHLEACRPDIPVHRRATGKPGRPKKHDGKITTEI